MLCAVHLDDDVDPEELRKLAAFLRAEDELRPGVSLVNAPATEGSLGGLADVLEVALGSGGAVTVLASCLCAYIKTRGVDLHFHAVSDSGAEVTFDAKRVRVATPKELNEFIESASATLQRQ